MRATRAGLIAAMLALGCAASLGCDGTRAGGGESDDLDGGSRADGGDGGSNFDSGSRGDSGDGSSNFDGGATGGDLGGAGACSDGVKDGDETAVDCGGADCPPCAAGQTCKTTLDCRLGACLGGTCGAVPHPVAGDQLINTYQSTHDLLLAADLDGDGLLDAITIGVSDVTYTPPGTYDFLMNEGAQANDYPLLKGNYIATSDGITDPVDAVLGDFDGDHAIDFAYVGYDAIRVAMNHGGTTLLPGNAAGGGYVAVAAGDLDGDGLDDLVACLPTAQAVHVYRATGGGQFSGPVVVPTSAAPRDVKLGDLDGDGHLDAAVELCPNSFCTVAVLTGDGLGGLGATTISITDGSGAQGRVAVVDVDGDGALDVITTFAALHVHLGDGHGHFAPTVDTTLGTTFATDRIQVVDWDGDGHLDVLYNNTVTSLDLRLFLGAGDGHFATPTKLTACSSFVIGDFDRDGKQDYLCAGTTSFATLHFGT